MFQGLAAQRLVGLFVFGWLALTFPLLGLWDVDATLFGVPLLVFAMFVGWAILIALVAIAVERTRETD